MSVGLKMNDKDSVILAQGAEHLLPPAISTRFGHEFTEQSITRYPTGMYRNLKS